MSIITAVGLLLALFGFMQLATYGRHFNFLLLLVLAAVSEVAAAFLAIDKSKVAYEVGTAVSLAAVPFYGPFAAIVIVTVTTVSFWLFNNRAKSFSDLKWHKLGFNVGMHNIAVYVAGAVYLALSSALGGSLLHDGLAWAVTAVVHDQLNLWLLIIMLWLLQGREFEPVQFWKENRWAMVVNITVLAVGGFLLATALRKFDSLGILIFFLPILLSSFSFQLYVRKMKAHLNNLEEIIAERTSELSTLIEEKNAFLSVLTHDMKTPLTSIGLYADMLLLNPGLAEKKPKMIGIIKRSQQNLVEIVTNILDLEKLEAGNDLPMEKESVNLTQILSFTVDEMEVQADSKNIQIEFQNHDHDLMVHADAQLIKRVLQNLISNAIKYTPQNGKIQLVARVDADRALVEVFDNGYGIPTADLPCVFDRYRRVAKHEKSAVGSGLGLAIAKAIVEAHGGQILVTSEENVGSCFTLKLPLLAPQPV